MLTTREGRTQIRNQRPNVAKNPHTDTELKAANQLTGSELFSLFTADIIKEKTLFTR